MIPRGPVLISVAISLAIAIGITGCAAHVSRSEASPSPAPTPHYLAGIGTQSIQLAVPAWAHSVAVTVYCLGGNFSLNLNAEASARSGSCGTANHYQVPVEPKFDRLQIAVPDESRVLLSYAYSNSAAPKDAVTAAECSNLSRLFSSLQSADQAYRGGAIDANTWQARVKTSVRDLSSLPPHSGGVVGQLSPSLRAWLTRSDMPVGSAYLGGTDADFDGARDLVAQACAANGTPLTLTLSGG